MTDTGVETELKIPVEDLSAVRSTLAGLDARLITESSRETNLLLDTENRDLSDRGCVLRLRRYGSGHVLTFKGPSSYDGPIKVRPEYELEIESVEKMIPVLEALGFSVAARYEKDREIWNLGDVVVVLDHTPMGDFVEVEGPQESLGAAARLLGLEPSHAVRGSYVSLWQDFRESHTMGQLPENMVFEE